ncbi:DUF262 domain-containing protein [Oceanicaulis sp. UBA2681]|uniref:DUF262 domain-containing protein n=1 Tax=Oceanicaulis sp. UBA2681 TaxID=1947007 RepID=UPI00257D3C84|nr:DUF262 domain-containing protein [Oceanicaulis sp. UBA2681]
MADLDDIDVGDEPVSVGSMVVPAGIADTQIEKHYQTGRLRVVQEKNDIFLTHVLSFIGVGGKDRVWSNIRPEYQRRLRWDNKKKSQLIESFIMNVPVPPIFLYEKNLGEFEVMDGQQRLNAIASFYEGDFALQGLKVWQALNGKRYSQLPPLIRRGLDRAKISAITLTSDNTSTPSDSIDLRAQVFDRLNTGGERLNPQELRNALYSGSFNDLVIDLSRLPKFTTAWEIPEYASNVLADGSLAEALEKNNLFKRMTDVEIVVRFFAFKDKDSISGSVRGMLDDVTKRNRYASENELAKLREDFEVALDMCVEVFGDDVFRLPPQGAAGRPKLSRPLFDAEMVGMYLHRERKDEIFSRSDRLKTEILGLATDGAESYELMVGRANTASSIKDRIEAVSEAIVRVLDGNA